jgi:tetratricopeptide (TPR) repeat protein
MAFFGLLLAGCSTAKEVVAEPVEVSERTSRAFKQSFFSGQQDKLSGNFESAANHFQKCIELIPEESAPYFELARIRDQQNRLEQVVPLLEKAIALDADNIWYQSFYAQINARLGRYPVAVATYKEIIARYPEQFDYHFELAGTYIMLGDYDAAVKVFDGLEKTLGMNEEISMQKQMLYMEMGKTEDAIREVKKLVEVNPDEIRYLGILAELYDKNGQPEMALETYERLAQLDADNGMLRLSLSEFYRNAGDHERAYEELQQAFKSPDLEIDSKINVLLNYYAETEENPELLGKAYTLCEILIEHHPDEAKSYSIYGDYLYRDERIAEARDQFIKAAKIDKSRFIIWNQILILDSQLEDFDSMISTSEKALELFPTMPSFYLFNGVGHLQKKNYNKAIESLLAGIDLVYENFEQLGQFYASLGDAYHAIGDHAKSDEAYENSLSIESNNAYVLNNYSYYLSLRGENLEEALDMAKKANKLQPGEASFQDTKAWVLYQLSRYEEAREWLEKALNNGGINEGTILEHYGDVLYKLNRKAEALDYWKQALKAGGASDLIERKIADKILHE